MKTATVIAIRHTEKDGDALTPRGLAQIQHIVTQGYLAPFVPDRVLGSSYGRIRQMAEVVTHGNMNLFEVDDRLIGGHLFETAEFKALYDEDLLRDLLRDSQGELSPRELFEALPNSAGPRIQTLQQQAVFQAILQQIGLGVEHPLIVVLGHVGITEFLAGPVSGQPLFGLGDGMMVHVDVTIEGYCVFRHPTMIRPDLSVVTV